MDEWVSILITVICSVIGMVCSFFGGRYYQKRVGNKTTKIKVNNKQGNNCVQNDIGNINSETADFSYHNHHND